MQGENPNHPLDILVIGGGVAGAAVARDAALRGLSVALFEKNTLGSGTSSKSSKLIHGGIRYLELAWMAFLSGNFYEFKKNLRFVFHSLREQHLLEKNASQVVQPLAIVIPVYQYDKRRLATIFIGTLTYFLLALLSGKSRPPLFFPTKNSILKKVPELSTEGLRGGVMIWECLVDDKHLVELLAASAKKNGAEIYEQAPLLSYAYDDSPRVYSVHVTINNSAHTLFAKKIINASGPWVDSVRKLGSEKEGRHIAPIAGSHIMVKKFLSRSLLLQAEDGRFFFVINIGDYARVGTTERLHENPDTVKPTAEDTLYLLESLKRYFPEKNFGPSDILSSDAGVRPLASSKINSTANALSREHEIRVGPTGVVHLLGVKLTDHRRAAQEVLDCLMPEFRRLRPGFKGLSSTHKQKL